MPVLVGTAAPVFEETPLSDEVRRELAKALVHIDSAAREQQAGPEHIALARALALALAARMEEEVP
jgi:hypothetical protein